MNSVKHPYVSCNAWFYCDDKEYYRRLELFIDAARCSDKENKLSNAKKCFSTGNRLTVTQELASAKVI